MLVEEIFQHYEALLQSGHISEAGEFLEESAASFALSGDTLAAASCYNELEGFWRVAGKKEKSYSAAEKALSIMSENGLADSLDYATALLNYATAKGAFGENEEALEIYRKVEARYLELLPGDDYRLASLFNNMAQSLLRLNNIKEAEDYFARSLRLLETMAGVDVEIATGRTNLAFCLTAQRRFDEAEEALAKSEKFFEGAYDDPHHGGALSCRGQLEYLKGNFEKAAAAYKTLADITERRYGRNMRYAGACRSAAKALEAAGKTEEALRMRQLAESAAR